MKVTEWQMTLLVQTLRDSLKLSDDKNMIFSYGHEVRAALLGELLDQQDGILETTKDEGEKEL